jgi:surface polysaccharide O-acyltransferase-like enzyme
MSRITSDMLRIMAMIGVVVIHSSARSERIFNEEHLLFSSGALGALLNQLSRFCVPVFVVLSGFGLAKSMAKEADRPLMEFPHRKFFTARFEKIMLPYLFLTFIFLIGYGRLSPQTIEEPLAALGLIARALTLGNAEYHLYFLSIILQCYMLFPFLIRINSKIFLASLFILHTAITYPAMKYYGILPFGIWLPPTPVFIYWLFYFYLGIYTAKNEARIVQTFERNRALMPVVTILALFFLLTEYVERAFSEPHPDYYNHFNRHTIILYTLSIFWLFIAFDKVISIAVDNREWVSLIASLTFPVYLYHTTLLRLLNLTPLSEYPLILCAVTPPLSFAFVYALHRVMPHNQFVRNLSGLPGVLKD